jgi:phosphatidylinositol alpha-1,6-mannosyltransferase
LAIDFPPSVGGVQRYLGQLWGHGGMGRVTVIARRYGNEFQHDRMFGGRIERVGAPRGPLGSVLFNLQMLLRLALEVRRGRIYHVTHVGLGAPVLPLLWLLSPRLVVWGYALELTNARNRLATRTLLGQAARVVVISEYTRALAVEFGARSDRILKIWPGGDDLYRKFPHPQPARFRGRFGIDADVAIVLSVGRASRAERYKGLDRAIDVAAELLGRGQRFAWVVVGGGDDLSHLRAAAAERGLADVIRFVGRVEDEALADAYVACDLFCHLAREEVTQKDRRAEGYAIVISEAGSFRKPAVALKRGGVPDAVVDGVTGVLIDEDDPIVIADVLEDLLSDPARRARLGEAGFLRATGVAGSEAARNGLRRLIASLVEGNADAVPSE